jgi:hypothetical protein
VAKLMGISVWIVFGMIFESGCGGSRTKYWRVIVFLLGFSSCRLGSFYGSWRAKSLICGVNIYGRGEYVFILG